MKFVTFVSSTKLDSSPPEGCSSMCGMCPSCAFAAKPPGSVQRQWKVSDEVKRRFLTELLLRCKDVRTLENIQKVLSVTSWTLFTYTRSRSSTSSQHHPSPCEEKAARTKPVGLDLKMIWDWFNSSSECLKLRYLCRVFALCDSEMLRMAANLTSVLLVRQKRGFLQFNDCCKMIQNTEDEDPEDPALMVVPGSLRSVSGVRKYRDFIGCLHVDISKRILGLLDEDTLKLCQEVCRYWRHLAQETLEEMKLSRKFQDKMKDIMEKSKAVCIVSSTHAKIVDVPVPLRDDDEVDTRPPCRKVKLFEAAYANIRTKTVPMEERNVYCSAYFTTVLVDLDDPSRVVDYRGGPFIATGSKDRVVKLLYVTSQTETVSVLKGHVGSIQVVLLCQERDLLISASSDASIRCWNFKTDTCVMMLYGHTRAVNCLDVRDDRLVSGAKDGLVKVWSLHSGKHFENLNFKHPSSVRRVKINKSTVYSSCNKGLIKIWDMENARLLRVIDAHKDSVKCLFLDEWHLLSGDSVGQVMAWSTSCDVKDCLMTFNHQKEVKSLTLAYLRVITGCVDGKIRVFNFLTGDCLREIKAAETGGLLSLHFHENSILVNSVSSVKRYEFAKVFWDYRESTERGGGDALSQNYAKKVTSAGLKTPDFNNKKTERSELLYHICCSSSTTKSKPQGKERYKSALESVVQSDKAASEQIRKRGLHHPLTRDSILLKINTMQRARSTDEVSINMECNAQLRDSWGPETPNSQINPPQDPHLRRPKTCVPTIKRAVSKTLTDTVHGRARCYSADTRRPIRRQSGFSISAVGRPLTPEQTLLTRFTSNPESSMKTSTSLPRISSVSPVTERGGYRLITVKQLEDSAHSKRGPIKTRGGKKTKKIQ